MLEINHLKMLQALVQFDTMAEAADKLAITQPALSNRLREAERRLGLPLFTKSGRKLKITPHGERLLYSATRILNELERSESDIQHMIKGVEFIMRLGVPDYVGYKNWLPKLVTQLGQQQPEVAIHIVARSAKETIVEFIESDVNIALTTASMESIEANENFGYIKLFKDELVALLPASSPKAKKKFLREDDFDDLPYITNSAIPQKNREYELYFVPEKIMPKRVIQAGTNEAIIELVSNGIGMTIMSKWIANSYIDDTKIAKLPLKRKGLAIDWHIVYRKDNRLASAAAMLAEILTEEFSVISRDAG